MLLPKNELCFPEYTDSSILANDIGRFFDRKIAKIRAELDACTLHPGAVAEDKVFTGDRKLDHFNTYSVEDMFGNLQNFRERLILDESSHFI